MLVFRIVATILMGFSCAATLLAAYDETSGDRYATISFILEIIMRWSWRAFVIVALWVI